MESITPYDDAVDAWSLGCVMAEMLRGGRALLCGCDSADQLHKIVHMLGMPSMADLAAVTPNQHTLRWTKSVVVRNPYLKSVVANLEVHCPKAAKVELSLIAALLEFNPSKRLRVAGALEHAFLHDEHRHRELRHVPLPPDAERVFGFECPSSERLTCDQWRALIRAEVKTLREKSAHEAVAATKHMMLRRGAKESGDAERTSPKRAWSEVQLQ